MRGPMPMQYPGPEKQGERGLVSALLTDKKTPLSISPLQGGFKHDCPSLCWAVDTNSPALEQSQTAAVVVKSHCLRACRAFSGTFKNDIHCCFVQLLDAACFWRDNSSILQRINSILSNSFPRISSRSHWIGLGLFLSSTCERSCSPPCSRALHLVENKLSH